MIRHFRNTVLAALLSAACFVAAAAGNLTIAQLQRLLESSAKPEVAFQEIRESPWLSAPLTSRGTLRSLPDGLEKQVDSPRKETWRLLADRMEWSAQGQSRQILFSQAPAVAPLANLMRRAVAGDFAALQRDFRIELTGDERVWSALLRPRTPEAARYLDHVELQGSQNQLQVIIVVERSGERTTTRLSP